MPKRSPKASSKKASGQGTRVREPEPGAHFVPSARSGPPAWAVAAILAVAIGAVYGRALDAPFIFDDSWAITENESIRSLWPLIGTADHRGPLNAAPGLPAASRPLVNFSFALNYYFGGLSPTAYHAVNVTIHFLSALMLWAITRRTLQLSYFSGRFDGTAGWLGLAVAVLWALHPLQTEAVIYATQRTELMMAFFYLATLYCSLQYWTVLVPDPSKLVENQQPAGRNYFLCRSAWLALAVISCVCGMASKEVMVSAPLMVLLFERTFVAGSLAAALRRSWPLYIGLAMTWLLLVGLTMDAPHRDSAGFGLGVSAYAWWLTQTKVLLMYLKLVVWPWPLMIHYQLPYVTTFAQAWMYVIPVTLLAVATLVLLWRNRPIGYLLTLVFAILSPTSLIPIVAEMAAERRMYLALVTPCVLFVVGGYWLMSAILRWRGASAQTASRVSPQLVAIGLPVLLLAIVFWLASTTRLAAYDNEMNLWLEVLQSYPHNYLAHQSVAVFLERDRHDEAALEQYREATRLNPDASQAHYQLALLLNKKGRHDEAATHLAEALRSLPKKNAAMQNNLAVTLYMAGRNDQAIEAFHQALSIEPNYWPAYRNMGTALQKAGRYQESVEAFEAALRLNSKAIEIYNDLAKSYIRLSQQPKALATLKHGLELARAAGDTENTKKFTAALDANR